MGDRPEMSEISTPVDKGSGSGMMLKAVFGYNGNHSFTGRVGF